MKKLLEYLSLLKGYKLYLAILFFFIIWMTFFDANSILTHHELNKEREKLNKQKQFLKREYDQLVAYYDSKQWRQDYFDSNDGKIPNEVPQWVLTQDAIFDAIGTQFYLADEYRTLLDKIKAKEMNP